MWICITCIHSVNFISENHHGYSFHSWLLLYGWGWSGSIQSRTSPSRAICYGTPVISIVIPAIPRYPDSWSALFDWLGHCSVRGERSDKTISSKSQTKEKDAVVQHPPPQRYWRAYDAEMEESRQHEGEKRTHGAPDKCDEGPKGRDEGCHHSKDRHHENAAWVQAYPLSATNVAAKLLKASVGSESCLNDLMDWVHHDWESECQCNA